MWYDQIGKVKVIENNEEASVGNYCACRDCINSRKLGSYMWSWKAHDYVTIVEISEDGLTIWVE